MIGVEEETLNVWQSFRSIAVVKSIAAITFVLHRNRNTDKVTMKSCTGWARYIGRFSESRTYEFTLDAQLSNGDAGVVLLDKKKETLLQLNQQSPTGEIALDRKNRYYLKWEFQRATGKCELRW